MALRRALPLSILLLLGGGARARPETPGLMAVLLGLPGPVTVASPGPATTRSVRRAASYQSVGRGDVVHVPAGAKATLLCSNDGWVTLTGPKDWTPDPAACGPNRAPAGSYLSLTAPGGRIRTASDGSMMTELDTRAPAEEIFLPRLLSPRHTKVEDPRPLLVWSQNPRAAEYEVVVEGPEGFSVPIAASDARCQDGAGPWKGTVTCSWQIPPASPALPPAEEVFLRIGFRRGLLSTASAARKSIPVKRLSAASRDEIRERIQKIQGLPLDPASRLLLEAGAYAQAGLSASALERYSAALEIHEFPAARAALADLYLQVDLPDFAEREYRRLLAAPRDPLATAAAELGLGWVAYARQSDAEAQTHFAAARKLYAGQGLTREAEEAGAAAQRAQARNRRPPQP